MFLVQSEWFSYWWFWILSKIVYARHSFCITQVIATTYTWKAHEVSQMNMLRPKKSRFYKMRIFYNAYFLVQHAQVLSRYQTLNSSVWTWKCHNHYYTQVGNPDGRGSGPHQQFLMILSTIILKKLTGMNLWGKLQRHLTETMVGKT